MEIRNFMIALMLISSAKALGASNGIATRIKEVKTKSWQAGLVELTAIENAIDNENAETKALFFAERSRLLFRKKLTKLAILDLNKVGNLVGNGKTPSYLKPLWNEARNAYRKDDLDELMMTVEIPEGLGDDFTHDRLYFNGLKLAKSGKINEARKEFLSMSVNSYFYPKALLQLSLLAVAENRLPEAQKQLRSLLVRLDLPQGLQYPLGVTKNLRNLAWLNLGRINYDSQRFQDSIKAYRNIERTSPLYFDGLFEQSWALFMGGFPNHALGSLYSQATPWFADRYKPESEMLETIIYFWLCNYNAARDSLARFLSKYQSAINGLDSFVKKRSSSPQASWDLFENFVTGVSSESLGIDRQLIAEAVNQESMMSVRAYAAGVLEEKIKLQKLQLKTTQTAYSLDRQIEIEEQRSHLLVGQQLIRELKVMSDDFKRLREHAELIYVEVLMSEKENLVQKELHKESKFASLETNKKPTYWTKGAKRSWAVSDKHEYWLDELGFYVMEEKSQCDTDLKAR